MVKSRYKRVPICLSRNVFYYSMHRQETKDVNKPSDMLVIRLQIEFLLSPDDRPSVKPSEKIQHQTNQVGVSVPNSILTSFRITHFRMTYSFPF